MIIQETTKMSEREKMAARNSNFCYLLNALYPVGSIYVSKDPTEPAELFGGSWKRIKERFIWAIGDNENPGDTGGEKTHTLSVDEMPSHNHSPSDFDVNGNWVPATDAMSRTRYNSDSAGTKYIPSGDSLSDWKWGKTSSVGGSQPHNNMPPWEGFYIWERIESDVPMGGSAGMLLADQTYNPESASAQSGIAVAQAIDTCSPAIVTASDTGKAISIPDSSESAIKGLTAYGESTQDGTPTPDSPVEIVSVENPVISVYGKNLFDKDTMIISGAYVSGTGQYQTSASSEKTAIIPVPKNSTVTFSKIVTSILRVGLCTVYPTSGTQLVSFQDVSNKMSFTAATGNNSYLVAFFYNNSGETVNYEEVINSIQLEIGSTVTNYEPYTVQTVTIPYTFRGLKNTTTGQWSARDELRVGDGKVEIVRNVGTYTFNGTETWNLLTSETPSNIWTLHLRDKTIFAPNQYCLSSKLQGQVSAGGETYANNSIWLQNTDQFKRTYIALQGKWTSVVTAKQWLASNNIDIQYVNLTPEIEDITATEAGQALLALKLNYPVTSVISDMDLNVTYKADTKNYIDNKFAALTALTLEG